MLTLADARIIEGETEADESTYFETLQRAINGGAWGFQGSYGRAMMQAIESGRCLLGRESFKDAYGSKVPSRFEVKPGTKGSREYVAAAQGEEWAARLAEIGETSH